MEWASIACQQHITKFQKSIQPSSISSKIYITQQQFCIVIDFTVISVNDHSESPVYFFLHKKVSTAISIQKLHLLLWRREFKLTCSVSININNNLATAQYLVLGLWRQTHSSHDNCSTHIYNSPVSSAKYYLEIT